ncbi:hypothetical protein PT974_08473 [Cladobotryum mycophilum]|uniref:Uncharacterized protein n=1 Tax=Cladobotryum mycophilum TaxID=491253 RepID=A0ABR0SDF6_9HYPO
MSSSIARPRPVRSKPAVAPTTTITTRSATRAAAAAAAAAAAESKPQPRTASPSTGVPLKPHARTVSEASSSSSSSRASATVKPPTRAVSSSFGRSTPTTRQATAPEEGVQSVSSVHYINQAPRHCPSEVVRRSGIGSAAHDQANSHTHTFEELRHKREYLSSIVDSLAGEIRIKCSDGSAPRTLHRRTVSVDKAATTQPPRPPSTTSTTSSTPTAAQPRVRSAFSTVQQHYSSAKSLAPKPPASSHLAPPTPSRLPPNVTASAEISKLQAELLQLYLLHRDATTVNDQWKESAKKKLGEQFLKLCEENREVAERERVDVERQNVLALRRWGTDGRLEDKIQSLEAIITGVWSLSDPDGRYARIVRQFEHWIDTVTEVEEARKREDGLLLQGQDTLFIGELDETWKDECEGLIRRLTDWKKQLNGIGLVPNHDDDDDAEDEKSSLTRMLDGSRNLIDDTLAELTMMEQIEHDALTKEKEWIQRMNRDDEDEDDDTPRARAAWRVM